MDGISDRIATMEQFFSESHKYVGCSRVLFILSEDVEKRKMS